MGGARRDKRKRWESALLGRQGVWKENRHLMTLPLLEGGGSGIRKQYIREWGL